MWSAVRSAFDVGLQGQASRLLQDQTSRLMLKAEAFKDRTLEDARGQAVSAGVTVALVLFGLLFAAVAVGIGLVALYHAVALVHGPLAGYAAAGGSALVISLAIFRQFHSTGPISLYLAGSCAVSCACALLARETKGLTFDEIDARGA